MQDHSLSSKSAVFSPETVIMAEHENDDYDSLEIYRDYLMMIARWMMGLSYRGKFDADEIVNQTLFEAYQQLESHHGSGTPKHRLPKEGIRSPWVVGAVIRNRGIIGV